MSGSIQISKELFNLLCQHFRVNQLPDTDPTEETAAEYNRRETRIKALLTEKSNKMLLHQAFEKITSAKTPEEKEAAYNLYIAMKKML